MNRRGLMVQGTTSDAGKSTLVAGLCRVFKRRGVRVAPFKPQNMALNSAVTVDGGEIGRAQAVQAQACGIEPHTDMNPVLLKPNSDCGSQVIIHGHAIGEMGARSYHQFKPKAMEAVIESYQRLQQQFDVVLVEGAGSPAEINLRDNDVANMGFAEAVDCPVLLVADIDRGGVFAHLVGTMALLSESERARVEGLVINRFRGDVGLLQPGLDWLAEREHKSCMGVLPYLHDLHLEAEDSLNLKHRAQGGRDALKVVVPRLPRMSNHTDFDPLGLHDQVDLQFVGAGDAIPNADLIILPGSKSVRSDLEWLRRQGWEQAIQRHLRYGGRVLGICGGYQMLGQTVHDPEGIESAAGSTAGFGLLEMETQLATQKQLRNVSGCLSFEDAAVVGYEIHAGVSRGSALERPLVMLDQKNDGAISQDGQVVGTYLHGLFDGQPACDALLRWAGLVAPKTVDYQARREADIERLADMCEQHLDMAQINMMLDLPSHLKGR